MEKHKYPFAAIRNAFLSGLIVLAPLGVSLLVLNWLVESVGGNFREVFLFFIPEKLLGRTSLLMVWNIIATIIALALVTLLGFLSKFLLGKYIANLTERIFSRVPILSIVYATVKQIVDTFSHQRRAVFQRVVMLEFPRKGAWVIGFLTNVARGEPQARTSEELWTIFVPTTPNPTSGFLIMLPQKDIIEMDMTVGEGMKLIISGGAVTPPWPPAETARLPEAAATKPPAPERPTPHGRPSPSN